MEIAIAFFIIVGIMGLGLPMSQSPQNESAVYIGNSPRTGKIFQELTPISESYQANIVKQQYDYSCGSAALATILKYYLGEELSEEEIIRGLVAYGDTKLIEERRAFSLLDMKRFVEVLGYKGSGYKAEIDDLRTLGRPCIVPIEIYGYNHFVVFKGMYGDHIFFADPALGNISFSLGKFSEIWHLNIIFVVYPKDEHLTLSALTLKDSDLRIIDTYALRVMTDKGNANPAFLEQRNVLEATGKFKYYRER